MGRNDRNIWEATVTRPICVVLALALLFAGACADPPELIRIRAPIVDSPESPKALALERLGAVLDSIAPDRFSLQVTPSAALGGESDYLRSMGSGSYEMTVVSAGVLAEFEPQFSVLDLPFVFPDAEEARLTLDGELGDRLRRSAGSRGFYVLAFWEQGFRSITTSGRPAGSLDELQGLKIRTMSAPNHVAAFRALGAAPTPMEWGEVYTSLQTGVIDGQENPPSAILQEGIYEVQTDLFMTRHVYDAMPLVVRDTWFDGLEPADQAALVTAVETATLFQRTLTGAREAVAVDSLAALGMTVHYPTEEVRERMASEAFPAVAERIRESVVPRLAAPLGELVSAWFSAFALE